MPPKRTRSQQPARALPAALLVGVVLVALAIRLWAMRYQPWVTIDGTDYIRFSEALNTGPPYLSPFPPGYPALIALIRVVVMDRVIAAAMVSVVAGALLPWPVWLLARRAVGERWAIAPAIAVALHPIVIQYSTLTMSESAYLLALYGALAFAAASRALPAGLAIGAGFAIRPEALLPAAALLVRELRGGFGNAAAVRRLTFGAAGFLLIAFPCWLYFHATYHQWTLTPKLAAIRVAGESWQAEEARFLTPATGAPAPQEPKSGGLAHMLSQVPSRALTIGRFVIRLWPIPLLLLSIWGLTLRRSIEAIPLLHLLALPFIASEQPRFVLSAIPALAILAAVPLTRASRRSTVAVVAVLTVAGAIWCWAGNYREVMLPLEGYGAAQKEAGEWLGGSAAPEEPVMDRKPHVAFYARLPYRVMPDAPYDTLLNLMVRRGIRYMVLDEAVVRVFRPQLQPLIYDAAFREREPRVEMIYAGGHFKGYGLMIFRVLKPGEARSGAQPYFNVRWQTPGGELPGAK